MKCDTIINDDLENYSKSDIKFKNVALNVCALLIVTLYKHRYMKKSGREYTKIMTVTLKE